VAAAEVFFLGGDSENFTRTRTDMVFVKSIGKALSASFPDYMIMDFEAFRLTTRLAIE
jgi:hypothetical protein